jgi:hypothetical protein
MKSISHNPISENPPESVPGLAEATLRTIAQLPVPDGLEDRVIAGLKTAPRTARILHWPAVLHPTGSWMRGAAAAAILFVVAGGGWGIYMQVQPSQPARVTVMPPRAGAGGGFSSAGAMRTPQTLNGPIVSQPVKTQPAQIKPLKKSPTRVLPIAQGQAQAVAGDKATAQPALSAAK